MYKHYNGLDKTIPPPYQQWCISTYVDVDDCVLDYIAILGKRFRGWFLHWPQVVKKDLGWDQKQQRQLTLNAILFFPAHTLNRPTKRTKISSMTDVR